MIVDCNKHGTEHKECLLEISSIAQHPMFAGLLHPRSPGLRETFADACKASQYLSPCLLTQKLSHMPCLKLYYTGTSLCNDSRSGEGGRGGGGGGVWGGGEGTNLGELQGLRPTPGGHHQG